MITVMDFQRFTPLCWMFRVFPVGFPVVALCLPPANGLSSLRDAVDGEGRVAGGGMDHHSGCDSDDSGGDSGGVAVLTTG
jgi:hypothetical protein